MTVIANGVLARGEPRQAKAFSARAARNGSPLDLFKIVREAVAAASTRSSTGLMATRADADLAIEAG